MLVSLVLLARTIALLTTKEWPLGRLAILALLAAANTNNLGVDGSRYGVVHLSVTVDTLPLKREYKCENRRPSVKGIHTLQRIAGKVWPEVAATAQVTGEDQLSRITHQAA